MLFNHIYCLGSIGKCNKYVLYIFYLMVYVIVM